MLYVQEASLDYALTHIIARGDTDILPPAFEYNAIFHDWEVVKQYLAATDLDNWILRPARRCLSPKRGLGFRLATQLDPLDALLLTALVFEAGADLEAVRVPVASEVVHSHRFAPTGLGQLYDPGVGWDSFREKSLGLAAVNGGVVLATDIADFFPRLYHHPLENALRVACASADHARVIFKFLKGLNQGVSHGVPVGPAVVRLLSEVTIDDVDKALLSEGYVFCRYSDDYRIFVKDEGAARRALAFLATTLLQHHGLTLQESKTELIPAERFVERFSRTEEDAERASLEDKFDGLIDQLKMKEWEEFVEQDSDDAFSGDGLGFLSYSKYEDLSFDDLDADQQAVVNSLNLWELVGDEISKDGALDAPLARFALRRIADLKIKGDYELLFANISRLYQLFPHVLKAIAAQAFNDQALKLQLSPRLLDLFDDPVVGHLEYHRGWILSIFADDSSWNQSDRLVQLYNQYFDNVTRTELVLTLGSAGIAHWFRTRKQELVGLPPWERRAFLAGARCLPKDEAHFWYQSVSPQLDVLERAIVRWARTFLV